MDRRLSFLAILATTVIFLSVPSIVVLPAHALCGPGNASDTWTSGSGATVTITSTACPGTTPKHTATCTKDSNIVVDSDSIELSALDTISPNTGTRYDNTYSIGCPSSYSHSFGPYSGDAIPNCAYTTYTLNVHDSATQETHTLIADSYGQSSGNCPI